MTSRPGGGPDSQGWGSHDAEECVVRPFRGSTQDWDTLLEEFPDTTYCHAGGWMRVMAEVFGHEPLYRVAEDSEGRTLGLLPMVRVRSRLFGDFLLSMPFLSYGGPVGRGGARSALAAAAEREAEELGVDLLELRARNPVPGWGTVSDRRLTVLLDLPEDPQDLWDHGLKAKVRSQVRRPKKEGMIARFGEDSLDPFYEVFSRTMRDLGTPVLPRSFFSSIVAEFPDNVVCSSVHWKEQTVAAACGFLWKGELEVTWAGALREHSRMAPNMLLYWSLMEHAISLEARAFNFGRCPPGSGTHRFKSQWGGRDVALPWAQWTREGTTSTPDRSEKKYQVAISTWQKLPLPLANWLGPRLSKYLP